jgi:phage gpG-like protein
MAMRLEIKHTVHRNLDTPSLAGFYRKVGDYMVSSTVRKINGGIQPANAPLTVAVKKNSKTLRDRGQLVSSISRTISDSSVAVGTNHIGAKLNHFGGTVRAKKTYLYIPASARTRTMQRKYGPGIKSTIDGMRKSGYRVWWQAKGSKGTVLAKNGKRGKVFVLYVLKKEVTIPARPFLTIDETDRKVIASYAREELGL